MADVDVLRYVITGDTKGLKMAVQEADQVTAIATRNIIRQTGGVDAGFARAFSVKNRSLVDGINASIISMAGSFIPLGGNSRLAAAGLSQISSLLYTFGGPAAVAIAALGGLAAALLLTRDRTKEVEEALKTDAEFLQNIVARGGMEAAIAQGLLADKMRDINRLLKESEAPKQKELSFWEGLLIRLGLADKAIEKYLKRQREVGMEILRLRVAGRNVTEARAGKSPQQLLTDEFEERMRMGAKLQSFTNLLLAKEIAFRKKGETELADFAKKQRLQVIDRITADELKRLDLIEKKRREAIQNLINNAHRIASELGRVLGKAAENFIHQMIEGLSTIGANLKALKAGGIGGIAGGLGIAGTIFGVVGSIVDMFSSGAEQIHKSNVEVVHAIQDWIADIRGQTKEELIAGRQDIEAGRKALQQFAGLTGDILRKNSDEFIKSLSESEFKQTFAAAAEEFKRTTGRRGSVAEVLSFMEQQLAKQEQLFDALVGGKVKSPDDVRALLKEQTNLDAQTGRMWIDFIARQNNWTPEQQKELFEELFNTLANSGNASVQELMALRDTITALEEGTANISEEGAREFQITRSVAGITENSANLVVGHLATINAVIQSIYELMQGALDNFTAAASGIPAAAGGVIFGPGAIVVNGGANATAREIVDVLSTDLRAKGVKI